VTVEHFFVLEGADDDEDVTVHFTDGRTMTGHTANGGVAFNEEDLPGGEWVREKVVIGTGTTTEVLIGRPSGSVGEHGVHLKFASGGGAGIYALEHRPADGAGFIPIGSYAEFQLISTNAGTLARNYKQEADLNLLGKTGPGNFGQNPDDQEWAAIGADAANFTGTFDGANKGITNLYIDGTGSNQGLFGVMTGTISNVHIRSGKVTGNTSVGGVVGVSKGTVTNCSNNGTVTGSGGYVGGVVGNHYQGSIIADCSNSGTVTGSGSWVGGVLGRSNNGGAITGCSNTGTVSGGGATGGVLGENFFGGTITGCSNTGTVSGTDPIGGVIGSSHQSGAVTGCSNTGDIEGRSGNQTGGVAGYLFGGMTNCSNSGTVTGSGGYVGGVVGNHIQGSIIADCSNSGDVTGVNRTGGVAGFSYSELTGCSNSGMVSGSEAVGGVSGYGNCAGYGNNGSITNCSNTGDVMGTSQVGGVVGYCNANTSGCFNRGTVTGSGEKIGGVAGQLDKILTASYNTGDVSGGSNIGGVAGANSSTVTACYYIDNGVSAVGANTGSIASLTPFSSPGAFPDVSGGHAAWGTGSGSTDQWWKTGTTNGGILPKLWFE
jgi:hypothetical protein